MVSVDEKIESSVCSLNETYQLDFVDEKRQTSNEVRRELLVSVEEKRQTSCEVGQELLVLVNEKGKNFG